jgi:hypothetical protein
VAIAIVLIVSSLVVVQASTLLFPTSPSFNQASAPGAQPGEQITPSGTTDLRPVFPTPRGGQGGDKVSSQPPLRGTVAKGTGPIPTPIITPAEGNLQISSIPQQVSNNSTVPVMISGGQPGERVRLVIAYSAPPYYTESRSSTIDANGQATLYWDVRTFSLSRKRTITARVTAVLSDGDKSSTVTVQITP